MNGRSTLIVLLPLMCAVAFLTLRDTLSTGGTADTVVAAAFVVIEVVLCALASRETRRAR
ncbi:hypothetical protein [Actinomadura macrotermitis]|uniref:Uncharacterized protein n=1 Tax=Actinomadura macrotermitis TaxID=2585200 RepID=A0A7K0BVX4_9ACTN|nr:hypothetical protein [Actinomadura macrotermitis]MQY05330.1 hypothetical protein [Actinomadura macrotermitis]